MAAANSAVQVSGDSIIGQGHASGFNEYDIAGDSV